MRTSAIIQSCSCAPVVQTFVPLTSQPPSVRVARVTTDARSLPESGSLMPMQNESSPRQIPGRNRSRLLLAPELGDQRTALTIGDPVVADRGTPAQQLLRDHEPLDRRAVAAAVLPRERHPDPSARGELLREGCVRGPRHAEARCERSTGELRGQERPHLALQRELGRAQLGGLEPHPRHPFGCRNALSDHGRNAAVVATACQCGSGTGSCCASSPRPCQLSAAK